MTSNALTWRPEMSEVAYGACASIENGFGTVCRDVMCANCYPHPCMGCGSPDEDACVCADKDPRTWSLDQRKALLAGLGLSLNADGTIE